MAVEVQLDDGRTIEFDDSFRNLSPEAQSSAVEEVLGIRASEVPASSEQTPGAPQTTGNPFRGAFENAQNVLSTATDIGEEVGDIGVALMNRDAILAGERANPFKEKGSLAQLTDDLRRGPEFQSDVSLRGIRNPVDAGRFIFDNVVASAPSGALLAAPGGAGLLAASETDRLSRERAERDGRDAPTLRDTFVAGAAAIPSAVLGRIGLSPSLAKGIKPSITQFAKATGAESATGFVQGIVEEGATGLGTEQGTTLGQMLENAGAEALIGVGASSAISGARQAQAAASIAVDNANIGPVVNDTGRLLAFKQGADLIDAEIEARGDDGLKERRRKADLARQIADRESQNLTDLVKELKKAGKVSDNKAVAALIEDGEIKVPDNVAAEDIDQAFSGRTSPIALARNSKREFGQPEIDQIAALGLDTETTDAIVQQLQVVDVLSKAGIGRNARGTGPSGLVTTLSSALGAGAAVPILSPVVGPFAAATIGGGLGAAVGRSASGAVNRTIDVVTGRAEPDIIRNRAAIDRVLRRRDSQVNVEAASDIANATAEAKDFRRSSSEAINRIRQTTADETAVRSEEARKLKNDNRLKRNAADPTGRYVRTVPNANGKFDSIDGVAMNELETFMRTRMNTSSQRLGLNLGPAAQQRLMTIALEDQRLSAKDIEQWNTDPESLIDGAEGFRIINEMKRSLDASLNSDQPLPSELDLGSF